MLANCCTWDPTVFQQLRGKVHTHGPFIYQQHVLSVKSEDWYHFFHRRIREWPFFKRKKLNLLLPLHTQNVYLDLDKKYSFWYHIPLFFFQTAVTRFGPIIGWTRLCQVNRSGCLNLKKRKRKKHFSHMYSKAKTKVMEDI